VIQGVRYLTESLIFAGEKKGEWRAEHLVGKEKEKEEKSQKFPISDCLHKRKGASVIQLHLQLNDDSNIGVGG